MRCIAPLNPRRSVGRFDIGKLQTADAAASLAMIRPAPSAMKNIRRRL
jgi:hypothetical protein